MPAPLPIVTFEGDEAIPEGEPVEYDTVYDSEGVAIGRRPRRPRP